ncbi:hypothetical protein [Gordonia sp. ABSL49_1]|uniref:hypothetical protein n=1 Tax=unclassified Gordonia (in: high G+C Gram-positive bacteria) TaxID=2657482 RepID=UPI001F11105C|nr:hypothetical protein [Gordonia sp. ABSL49_1]MCH5641784.1 hypothetical protein [Gordonia sp. ABSL49_1]
MALDLCCLLWAHPGRRAEMHSYEDKVLALVADHGGVVRQRAIRSVRQRALCDDPDGPDELQIISIGDRAALDRFMADPRRTALAAERDSAIARTELFEVALVATPVTEETT